jgi:hypothetical protein
MATIQSDAAMGVQAKVDDELSQRSLNFNLTLLRLVRVDTNYYPSYLLIDIDL